MSYRYLAYCRAHGLSPADMLSVDSKRYQGGRMTGYMLWIGQQWRAFVEAETGIIPIAYRSPAVHDKFDRWLLQLYPERPLEKV